MSKKLPAKHYLENKETFQKKACKRYQRLSKKSGNMVMNITKISQKMKSKSL